MINQLSDIINFIKTLYADDYIPLHRPIFKGNEKRYLIDCIDSNFVSTAGIQVEEFEKDVAHFTGSKYAVAVVNGTAALQISLQLAGVKHDEEVITQAVSFIATCNAISYLGARPVFVDVDLDTMGMSPGTLDSFLRKNSVIRNGRTFNKTTGKRFAACCPMHTFGTPCRIREIVEICNSYGIPVVEDAAESLGSFVENQHVGTFGKVSAVSFNGNKIITTGGGGMILTEDQALAIRAKHLTTTAKVPHPYMFMHDEVGYNFRLPSLNASVGRAQMEKLDEIIRIKKVIHDKYSKFFKDTKWNFFKAPDNVISNYWLNVLFLESAGERDAFLKQSNSDGVMTRPLWGLLSDQAMFQDCQSDDLSNSQWLESHLVNIPSSVP